MRSVILRLFTSFFVLGIVPTATAQNNLTIDKVVALVGDEYLLWSDVEEIHAYQEERIGVMPANARCVILEDLMLKKLLIAQAALDSVVVGEEEVDGQVDSRLNYMLGLFGNDEEQLQAYYGKSLGEIREETRSAMRDQMIEQRMRGEILDNVRITPSEVIEFFNGIPRDSLPFFSSEVEIGEIVVIPEVNEEEREKARTQLTDIRKRILNDGESFAELAKTYSDDPGSGRLGGDLGLKQRGTFVPEFEAVAYNLEEGEISDIVETEFGFHIIQMIERRGNLIHTRHILSKPNITQGDLDLAQNKLDSIRRVIINDSIPFSQAVKLFSNDKVQSYNNGGRIVNDKTGDSFFETADLETSIFFAIDTIEVGEITQPLSFKMPDQSVAFHIVQLQSITEPHTASLSEDYTKIKNAAIEKRKVEYLQEWVLARRGSTYISVIPEFVQDCENLNKWVIQNEEQSKPGRK